LGYSTGVSTGRAQEVSQAVQGTPSETSSGGRTEKTSPE
jgi:hypothetical protein